MHKSRFLQLVIFGTGLVLASAAVAQRDFADVEIRTHKVADAVYYLEGAGGNIEFLKADPAARYRGTHGDPERLLQAVYAELGGASQERR